MLQMPRGNLEAIRPRALVLPAVAGRRMYAPPARASRLSARSQLCAFFSLLCA